MKTLILYTSTHGTTEKLARNISDLLICETSMCNLKKDKLHDINGFDIIILGTSIHMGKPGKKMRKLLENKSDELSRKPHALYLCHMEEGAGAQSEFETAYPDTLRDTSISNGCFGGEYLMDKMNFIERGIIKKITGSPDSRSNINQDEVQRFISELNEYIGKM